MDAPVLKLVFHTAVGRNLDKVLDERQDDLLLDCFQNSSLVTAFDGVGVVDVEHLLRPGTRSVVSYFAVTTLRGVAEVAVEFRTQLRLRPEAELDGLTLSLVMLAEGVEYELHQLGLRPVHYGPGPM